ncbi:hypothetical protein DRJ17_06135 [Candidatus Woesearchaeota archaeon]|nr:MAG: hypothetical protein DRJ17_06135 [Candidatus Woesearchaeota archaeon]
MKSKIIFPASIILILFISGCVSNPFVKPTTQDDFRTGRQGILMEFLTNAPPSETYEDYPFQIGVMLKNTGAYDIKDGFVSFTIEEGYMELMNQNDEVVRFSLKGKSVSLPTGDQLVKIIKAKTKKIDEQSEKHDSTILANVCYKYQTKKDITTCIDTDIYNLKKMQKVCMVRDITLTPQGAPVAITKIESEMLPAEDDNLIKPAFKIYIKNVGNGEVIDKGKISDICSSEPLEHKELNIVDIKVMLSNEELECKPKPLKLKDDGDEVRCILEKGVPKDRATYTTPLTIELNYGYTYSISKKIMIKK